MTARGCACGLALLLATAPAPASARARRASVARPAATADTRRVAPVALDQAEVLAPFFRALQRLEAQPASVAAELTRVRVLHFGDSHTAADYWTGRLRALLQARFGDAGPGLLLPARPWRGYVHAGVRLGFSREWPAASLRDAQGDVRVGLAGAALQVPLEEALSVRGCFDGFDVLSLGAGDAPGLGLLPAAPDEHDDFACAATGDGLGIVDFAPDSQPVTLPSGERLHVASQRDLRARMPLELRVHVPEGQRLLGVELYTGRSGVVYDELGLNGAELTDLLRWDAGLRRALLERARPDLIVLAYGTNEMGRAESTLASYREQAATVLRTLAQESGAPLLVVGPPDRGARRRTTARRLAHQAPLVVDALRLAARDVGAAFWDARAAMGGAGSVSTWRRRGLSQPDLVHFTRPGYERLAELMAAALLGAYDDFRLRATAAHPAWQGAPAEAP